MSIANRLEEDDLRLTYGVLDIREIEAELLVKSGNPGDLALAVLAGGGDSRLREILHRAAAMKPPGGIGFWRRSCSCRDSVECQER